MGSMDDDSASSQGGYFYSCNASPDSASLEYDVDISAEIGVDIVEDEDGGSVRDRSTASPADNGSQGFTTSSSKFSDTVDEYSSGKSSVRDEPSTSDQPPKSRDDKKTRSLGLLLHQIYDDSVPVRRKIRWMKRASTIRGGAVELEVPGDITPSSSPLVNEVVDDEHSGVEADHTVDIKDLPILQIVMLIVGTRGDVQPFIAIGKRLQEFGHRVRLATHKNFEDFVRSNGLEFFPLGGDPKVLASYMVKHKGFFPSDRAEIHTQRKQLKDIINSLYPACVDPCPVKGVQFRPDAIIANPPAYGHTHVAEALKIPLHVFFTMPWTPTSAFPHPLSRVTQPIANRVSYHIVDELIWLGMRDIINDFRRKKLKVKRVSYLSASTLPDSPYGYIWSPHLVPKPKDWGPKIDVVGFCFLDLASNYKPPQELETWLSKDDKKPIYIGFGSLPVQEPKKMTEIIVQALEKTGQRGILNKGWGGLGEVSQPKDFVYLLDNCPHDWLFLQCAAVVHHGGAGTTAAGLKAACPTTIVPFFGDQPFWGERVHAKGVGPAPIPIEEFSLDKLVDAINFMLKPEVKQRAVELAKAMENEDGVTGAVNAFHKHYLDQKAQIEAQKQHELEKANGSSHFSILHCLGMS